MTVRDRQAPRLLAPVVDQVFVDGSGRRGSRLRVLGTLIALGSLLYVGVVVVSATRTEPIDALPSIPLPTTQITPLPSLPPVNLPGAFVSAVPTTTRRAAAVRPSPVRAPVPTTPRLVPTTAKPTPTPKATTTAATPRTTTPRTTAPKTSTSKTTAPETTAPGTTAADTSSPAGSGNATA